MPRRTRKFNRSNAEKYQVVNRRADESGSSESAWCLIKSAKESITQTSNDSSLTKQQLTYLRKDFELGEYGFADDGYDYAKHFKAIGGTGGVFIAAPSETVKVPPAPKSFQLRDIEGEEQRKDENTDILGGVRRYDDECLRTEAIAEIQRIRRHNADLDEVFAELDSDGELQSKSEEESGEQVEKFEQDETASIDDGQTFPDDFVSLAKGVTEFSTMLPSERAHRLVDAATRPPVARQKTVLDDQFEELMKLYENDDENDEHEVNELDVANLNLNEVSSTEDENEIVEDGMDDAALVALLSGGEFVLADTKSNEDVNERDSLCEPESSNGEVDPSEFNSEVHAGNQLTIAMDKVMNGNPRFTAEEAFAALDGIEGARKAIASNERLEEKRRAKAKNAESESGDSELENMLDGMYQEREQWDCQTIVSTYSNLDNHPSVIDDADGVRCRPRRQLPPVIQLDRRTELPMESVNRTENDRSSSSMMCDFGARRKALPENVRTRKKSETKEEKRARKAAVKEAARTRRALKSEMKKAFANAALTQDRHAVSLGKGKVAVQF